MRFWPAQDKRNDQRRRRRQANELHWRLSFIYHFSILGRATPAKGRAPPETANDTFVMLMNEFNWVSLPASR